MKLFDEQIMPFGCGLPRMFRAALILSLLFISSGVSNIFGERLPVKTYTTADGLLSDTVVKIKQDSRGFLWFCSGEGISRFDGFNFTNFTKQNGLPSGAVNDFLETRNGEIYLATNSGLVKINQAHPQNSTSPDNSSVALFTVVKPNSPKANRITVLFEDDTGTLFIGTSHGLYQKRNENLESVNLDASKTSAKKILVTAIIKDRLGALWIATEGDGLFKRAADGSVSQFSEADGLPGNNVASLLEDRAGNLWAGMRLPANAGLILLNGDAPEKPLVKRAFSTADGLPAHWIPSLHQSNDGKLWLGTISGLCEWQGADAKSVCRTYTAKNDLCDKDVWSVTEDRSGNLWTGSSCGAKKLARYGFTTYGEADGIRSLKISSIFENHDGSLFAIIKNNGVQTIYRFENDGKFTAVQPNLPAEKDYFSWGWKQIDWQDSSGAWLVPTSFGLFKFPEKTLFEKLAAAKPQKFSPATKGAEIFRVYEDRRGDVWIATTYGGDELWRWERQTNVWHDETAQILPAPNRSVSAFVEDRSGNLWIATGADEGAELIRYRDGQFKIFTEADNLPDGWIHDLYVDKQDRLWIANARNGLLRLDDVNAEALNFVRFTTADGFSSDRVFCITEDVYNRIYVGGIRGIDRLNIDTGQVENFTTADGLPSSFVETAFRDKNNNLWFGTSNGLAKFVPEPAQIRQPPTVLITGLRVNGEPQNVSILGETDVSKIELSADQRQISIDFVGLGANPGEKLKYEYLLENSDWMPTNERTVNFANLVAGNYQFEVRAVSAGRAYSLPARFSFKIAAPLWQRWWFIAAIVILTALAVYFFYKNRLARLLELERIRTRIATDLHDDIGANLTRISLLSEVAKQKNGDGQGGALNSIAGIARESVASMNDIVWAISPDHDSLLDLTRRMRRHAEEVFVMRDIDLSFQATEANLKLSVGVRRDVLLIFKEAVSNAAKHSGCSRVAIDFRAEDSVLSLRISDNGKGIDRAQISAGNGLSNMKNRAAKIGGKFEISGDGESGTTVVFTIPHV